MEADAESISWQFCFLQNRIQVIFERNLRFFPAQRQCAVPAFKKWARPRPGRKGSLGAFNGDSMRRCDPCRARAFWLTRKIDGGIAESLAWAIWVNI